MSRRHLQITKYKINDENKNKTFLEETALQL